MVSVKASASLSVLEKIAEKIPDEGRVSGPVRSGSRFDLDRFIDQHFRDNVATVKPWHGGGRIFILDRCPFSPEHRRTARIVQLASGALSFACFKSACVNHNWHSLRAMLGPSGGDEEWEPPARTRQDCEAGSTALIAQQVPVPMLSDTLLPAALQTWIVDIAARNCLPLEFVACPAIVALGAVLGRSVGICPDRYSDTVMVANLWGALIAKPGQLKSPAIDAALKPLKALAAKAHERYEKELQEANERKPRLEAEIASLQGAIQQAAECGDEEREASLTATLAMRAQELDEPGPTERRYIVNDPSIEKLGELLRDNPRGLLLYRDELAGWLLSMNRPGREGEREFYLEAWSGSGDYTFDRIGRGTIRIPALTLSVFGSIQPGKIQHYTTAALKGGTQDDGLLQRFQVIVWPDGLPPWEPPRRLPNREARARVDDIFQQLDQLDPVARGALVSKDSIPYFQFTDEAQERYDRWRAQLEGRLRSNELDGTPAFAAHLSKYRSLVPSLSLIFHLVELVDRKTAGPISLSALALALQWTEFLENHARKLYAQETLQDPPHGNSLEKEIINAVLSLECKVENGRLALADVTAAVNAARSDAQALSPQLIGRRVRDLGLTDDDVRTRTGARALVWDPQRMNTLAARFGLQQTSVTSVTSVTSENRDSPAFSCSAATDVSEVTDVTDVSEVSEVSSTSRWTAPSLPGDVDLMITEELQLAQRCLSLDRCPGCSRLDVTDLGDRLACTNCGYILWRDERTAG